MVYLFSFMGGIALFLYGMELMSEGLQKAAGERLQKILEKMTGVLALGVLLGAVVTGVLQSSGATTVMVIGLVNAGMLTFKQAFGVVMGANIGTTMTAQLVAFKLTDYITLLLFAGFVMQLLAKRQRGKYLGQTILGFGILMLGMEMMSHAVLPLKDYPGVTDFIASFGDYPLLGILVGVVMTVVVQSSSVTVGVLIVMASQGLINLDGSIPVLLGDNIGSCIIMVIASLRSGIAAKRVACAHVFFNIIGCAIFIVFLQLFLKLVLAISPTGDIARQIANAHTAFNVINTILFMPFAGAFVRLIERLMPQTGEVIEQRPIYLDKAMLKTPTIALKLAVKEVVRMGELARRNAQLGMESVCAYDSDKVKFVVEHEPVVDNLEREITEYLTAMDSQPMTSALSMRHTCLLHACNDIERIGDHGETLAKRSQKILETEDVQFSEEARQELQHLTELVLNASGRALEALEKDDKDLAAEAIAFCREVNQYQKLVRKNHIERLKEQRCNAVNGFIMMEIIINMKRISDHSKNIAQQVQGTF